MAEGGEDYTPAGTARGHGGTSDGAVPLPLSPQPLQQAEGGAAVALEAPLTRITVGMWASRHHRACQLLLLPERDLLVVLCDRRSTHAHRSPSRFSLRRLTARSPFASGHSPYLHSGCVHAFEVPFYSIRGLDYQNPLCMEARLVLETHNLRKREFPTMEAARAYFLEPTCRPQTCPSTPASASAPAPSPQASGQLRAALQANAAATTGAASPAATAGWDAGRAEQPVVASTSSARGDLMLKLGAGDAGDAGDTAGSVQQPWPASASGSKPLPVGRAAVVGAGAAAGPKDLPASSSDSSIGAHSERLSFESDAGSFDSELGWPWYYGSSPWSASRSASFLAASAAHATAAVPIAAAARGGSGSGHGSWEDLSASGIGRRSPQNSNGGSAWERPLLHVGSAPVPRSSLAAAFGSPPEDERQAAALGNGSGQPAGSRGLHRVASTGHIPLASTSRSAAVQQEEGPGEADWPAPHTFTTISKVYPYRTVVLHWRDPRLPGILRPVIQGNERLLKLYESGLPAWAVYAPQYGLYYRPWLRSLTWFLFYAFSVFSFVMGFYDLIKVVPGLKGLMQRIMLSVWLPPAAILEWLEQHTQFRLSILLTYLFGKSEGFVWLMRWATNFGRVSRAALQPLVSTLGPPLAVAGQALRLAGAQAWQALSAIGMTLAVVFQAGLAPIAGVLLEIWAAVGAALLPITQSFQHFAVGPVLWLGSGIRQLGTASGALWGMLQQAGGGLAAGAAAVAGTARAGQAVGSSTTQAVAEQALWLYVLPADAWEVLRTSAVKVAKAAQAVAKFCLQICENVVRHRLTLELRAGRAWRRTKQRLWAVAVAPLLLLAEVLKWLVVATRLLIVDRIEAGHRAVLSQEQQQAGQQAEQQATAGNHDDALGAASDDAVASGQHQGMEEGSAAALAAAAKGAEMSHAAGAPASAPASTRRKED